MGGSSATADLARFQDLPRPEQPGRAAVRRVVLVVFDELDYRLTFGSAQPARPLPAFERLRRESLSAEDATPPAANTNESMPGLLTGTPVEALIAHGTRRGAVRFVGATGETDLDSMTTIFARAGAMGFRSGLVGWNIPYCRTGLGAGLAACAWWPSGPLLGVPESLGQTMLHQWLSVSPWNSRAMHDIRHREMQDAALTLVADSTLSFVLLHLPVPHYPWIFDEGVGAITWQSFGPQGYRGNVRLADHDLDEIRRGLDSSPGAGRTTLIVTSDHPWRRSAELDGGSDPRVPFLLHFPGAREAMTLTGPINTTRTGELVLAILRGEVGTGHQAAAWFEARGQGPTGALPPP